MAHLIFHAEALNLGCVDFLPAAGGIREAWFTQPWANWGLSERRRKSRDSLIYHFLSFLIGFVFIKITRQKGAERKTNRATAD